MIYAETLEALCELPNEDLGILIKHINDWNNGKEIVIVNPFHKSFWKIILPDLERNRESYLTTLEKRQTAGRENGKLGGRPKKDKETQEKVIGLDEKVNNPNYNYNYINNISKDILLSGGLDDEKQETLGGVSVLEEETSVSKGLETLENAFPERKRDIGITEINLWNSLTQPQKANLVKKSILYVRGEMKNEKGQYIKKISKWLKEEIEKGVEEELIPNKKANAKQTFKYVDGTIYSILQNKLGSTREADFVWHALNIYGLNKEELFDLVKTETKENLLEIIKN